MNSGAGADEFQVPVLRTVREFERVESDQKNTKPKASRTPSSQPLGTTHLWHKSARFRRCNFAMLSEVDPNRSGPAGSSRKKQRLSRPFEEVMREGGVDFEAEQSDDASSGMPSGSRRGLHVPLFP